MDQIKRVKSVYRIFDLQVGEAGQTEELPDGRLQAKILPKNLTGCDKNCFIWSDTRDSGRSADQKVFTDRYGKGSCRSGVCSCRT